MNYPKFVGCKEPLSNLDLDAAEAALGVVLPSDLREHYLKYNGGRPKLTCYPFETDLYEVSHFYPIKHGGPTLEYIYSIVSDAIPEELIPFARDSAGNMYCYSVRKQSMHSICYWNDEYHDEPAQGIKVLAPTLQVFLEGLVKHPYI